MKKIFVIFAIAIISIACVDIEDIAREKLDNYIAGMVEGKIDPREFRREFNDWTEGMETHNDWEKVNAVYREYSDKLLFAEITGITRKAKEYCVNIEYGDDTEAQMVDWMNSLSFEEFLWADAVRKVYQRGGSWAGVEEHIAIARINKTKEYCENICKAEEVCDHYEARRIKEQMDDWMNSLCDEEYIYAKAVRNKLLN